MQISRRTVCAGLGAAVLAAPHIARAAPTAYRLGYNFPVTSHFGQGAAAFAQAVAADPVLSPVMSIEIHGNSELGDDLTMLNDCIASTLDFYLGANASFGTVIPALGVLDAPYLFKDAANAHQVLDGPVGAGFAALLQPHNITLLAWAENGLRHMTANKPVRTPADLAGLKLRVPQDPIMADGLRALGADTGQLSLKLLPDALRTGQFQAAEGGLIAIEGLKLYEYQKYLSLTGHVYDPAPLIVSNYVVQSLSPAQNKALLAAAAKAAAVTRTVAGAAAATMVPKLQAQGMSVVTDVDQAEFRAAAKPFLQTLGGTCGASLAGALLAACA